MKRIVIYTIYEVENAEPLLDYLGSNMGTDIISELKKDKTVRIDNEVRPENGNGKVVTIMEMDQPIKIDPDKLL